MTKIIREIDGKKVEIELTEQEEWKIYHKIYKSNMRDDILNVVELHEIRELTDDELEDALEYYMDHAGEGAYEDVVMNALDYVGVDIYGDGEEDEEDEDEEDEEEE